MKLKRSPIWLAIVSIAPIFISQAAQANDEVEELRVSGKNINLVGSAVSASEGFVDQSEISIRALARTGEIMELVPGMVATQHSGAGKANQYFLRGFNLDHGTDFATYVDGMPVNMRTHGHGQGYTDINFVIPEMIDSLAYKKGPYHVEVGDFSGAGSASFTTATSLKNGEVELSIGEDDYQRILISDSQANILNGTFLYAVELYETNGPWSDISEDVDKTNFLIKHTQRINDGDFSVSLMGYDNSWNGADQIPEYAVDAGIIDEFGQVDTTAGGESSRYSLNMFFNSDKMSYGAYVIDYDMDLISNFTYFDGTAPVRFGGNIIGGGDQFQQIDKRRIFGGSGHYHFDQGSMRNTIGGDFRYDDIEEVGLNTSFGGNTTGQIRSDEVEEWSAAIYWKNTMQWTKKLRTTFGVRYDYFDFDVKNLVNGLNANGVDLSANNGSADDDLLTAKGSITYQFTDSLEGYVSAGEGYHSNDARGTTTVINPEDGATIDPVDPLVKSEGYEIGFRYFVNEKINTSIAFWSLELDSELLFVGDAGNTEASGASEREGFELTAYYRIDNVWTLDLEYSYADAEFTNGDEIPGSVEDVIQAGVSARFDNGYYGSIRVRYFGEEPLEESGAVKGDSSTTVNAMIAKDWDQYGLKLEVLNLLDSDDRDIEYFYESRIERADGSVFQSSSVNGIDGDIHFRTMEPRTIRVSAHVKF